MKMYDFEFLIVAIRHPKFSVYHALQLFYLVADTYLNSIIYSHIAGSIMVDILTNFITHDALQEAVIKFIKASLAMFYSSEKNKNPRVKFSKEKNRAISMSKPIPAMELERETINAQKRALVIEILKSILLLKSDNLNEKAKTFILFTHVQLKRNLNVENKGIIQLLALFGDVEKIVEKFEKELRNQKIDPEEAPIFGSKSGPGVTVTFDGRTSKTPQMKNSQSQKAQVAK
mmetsp:Transcript_9021/g.7941  ORF Transcript_9021/g.7941 Transcript_9021/m.7941 type:complete len:231 (+) Transcript_9021:310-1002(+)